MYYFGINIPIVELSWLIMLGGIVILGWIVFKREKVKKKK